MVFLGDDDSFIYKTSYATTPEVSFSGTNDDIVDLCNFDSNPTQKGQKGKNKRIADNINPEDSFDLTSGTYEVSPRKVSRRAADEIVAEVAEIISLRDSEEKEEVSTQDASQDMSQETDEANNNGKRRSLRNRNKKTPPARKAAIKKTPKPKRLTYKQALAVLKVPIPPENPVPKPAAASRAKAKSPPKKKTAPPPAPRAIDSPTCDIDLTGDVKLTDKHSSAPLFQKPSSTKVASDISDDDDDEDFDMDSININVKLPNNKIQKYSHREHQRFYDLYKKLSDQDKVPISNIFLYNGDKRIDHDDTPHSTGYRISTILTCRIMETKPGEYKSVVKKKDQIELKFQSDKWKKPIAIKVSKVANFETILAILCEQISFKPEQVSLKFDGDDVELKDTPMDMEFEGGEILDCRIKA
jgi:hypothetical protein